MTPDAAIVGRALRDLRVEVGMTQEIVAKLSGVGMKTVASFEHSEARVASIRLRDLAKILDVYDLPLSEFFAALENGRKP